MHAVSRQQRSDEDRVFRWWQADVADLPSARPLLTAVKPDFVFHLASHVSGARGLELVMPTFHGNLVSAMNLMMLTSEMGCRRILLVGSLEESDFGDRHAVPCSPYAAAKWAGSAYARMFRALYELPVVMLRLFMVYGPGQKNSRKLVPYVIQSLLRGEVPRLSTGQRRVDWIYVDDVSSMDFLRQLVRPSVTA